MIDLHTHSTASDGSLTPTQLVLKAIECDLQFLGLTDHDTTAGLEEAHLASKDTNLTIINGIEISALFNSHTVHIVGLGIDPLNQQLQEFVDQAQQARIERAILIGEKLEQAGIIDAYATAVEMAGTTVLGRGNFAQMLVEKKHVKNVKKVFKRFMVRGKPGYVSAKWRAMQEAVEVIHHSGGIAVLAHPMRYGLSNRQIDILVSSFSEIRGDGIEFFSGNTTPKELSFVQKLADQYKLLASVGSDYHGPNKPWVTLGKIPQLPDTCESVWQKHQLWPQPIE